MPENSCCAKRTNIGKAEKWNIGWAPLFACKVHSALVTWLPVEFSDFITKWLRKPVYMLRSGTLARVYDHGAPPTRQKNRLMTSQTVAGCSPFRKFKCLPLKLVITCWQLTPLRSYWAICSVVLGTDRLSEVHYMMKFLSAWVVDDEFCVQVCAMTRLLRMESSSWFESYMFAGWCNRCQFYAHFSARPECVQPPRNKLIRGYAGVSGLATRFGDLPAACSQNLSQ